MTNKLIEQYPDVPISEVEYFANMLKEGADKKALELKEKQEQEERLSDFKLNRHKYKDFREYMNIYLMRISREEKINQLLNEN